jgi:hypothetical protein
LQAHFSTEIKPFIDEEKAKMDENLVDLEGKYSKYCATWRGAAEKMRAKKAELKQLKEKLQVTDLCTHLLTYLLTYSLTHSLTHLLTHLLTHSFLRTVRIPRMLCQARKSIKS